MTTTMPPSPVTLSRRPLWLYFSTMKSMRYGDLDDDGEEEDEPKRLEFEFIDYATIHVLMLRMVW